MKPSLILIIILVVVAGFFFYRQSNTFDLPEGESVLLETIPAENFDLPDASSNTEEVIEEVAEEVAEKETKNSGRTVFITDGVKHSIPLNEILAGGPPKDGIPSIDDPKFISTKEADETLADDDIGLGIIFNGETRFYPYQILVFHELVNDDFNGVPVLVTYCPLCLTGIVFDPVVDGTTYEFGVSGLLWQSNLLMYNRTANEEDESLWSQVLGEAVLGQAIGKKLGIIPSDSVTYGGWKKQNPDTKVLSRDTGATRIYGNDPYGDYYTSELVSFGASFRDERIHPKAFVFGIEVNGLFKAYDRDALEKGTTVDTFAGETITIEKDNIGAARFFIGEGTAKKPLDFVGGFWFSWIAVHPDTELSF